MSHKLRAYERVRITESGLAQHALGYYFLEWDETLRRFGTFYLIVEPHPFIPKIARGSPTPLVGSR